MLVQFCVENFRSIDSRQGLSMRAGPGAVEDAGVQVNGSQPGADGGRVHHTSHAKVGRVLRIAALYGPNGAGKSNVVRALSVVRRLLRDGVRPGRNLPYSPFKLREGANTEPSKFQFHLLIGEELYDYGICFTQSQVTEEWLYATHSAPRARERMLFHRIATETGVEVRLGDSLRTRRSRLKFIAEDTRPEQPFLTEASERGCEVFEPVRNWFETRCIVLTAEARVPDLPRKSMQTNEFLELLRDVLPRVDLGVEDVRVETRSFSGPNLCRELGFASDLDAEEFLRNFDGGGVLGVSLGVEGGDFIAQEGPDEFVRYSLRLKHSGENAAELAMDEESDGTLRILHLMPMLHLLRRESGRFVVVDELERRLHPSLTRWLLEQVVRDACTSESQFLFTTHDTNLLHGELLHRDEVWLAEKDPSGATMLMSVEEFRIRKGANLEGAYLAGRFGAVPLIQRDRDAIPTPVPAAGSLAACPAR